MRHTVLVAATLLVLAAPCVAAQDPSAVASTRVRVTVPEPRSKPTVRVGGHSDRSTCSTSLEFASIGRLSVSCLDTGARGDHLAGVALLIVVSAGVSSDTGSSTPLAFILDDGATIQLQPRSVAGPGPSVEAVRVTLPTAAFERIAASTSVTMVARGTRYVLGPDDIRDLRQVAVALRGRVREADSAVAQR